MCGVVAHKFGISSLHPWQMNAILSTLEGRDTLVVQPTGKGKSLCFVIPPLCNTKTAVVISPTISLMTDQVGKLNKKGIRAVQLGSAQKDDILQQVQDGYHYPLIFTTPESFLDRVTKTPKRVFLDLEAKSKLSVIAVDEAHLISSWQSFR